MEKNQTERERAARNHQDERPDRLRDTVLAELSGVLPFEAYAPEQPLKRPAP